MKIAISVESTADFNKETLEEFDVKVIPFQIVLGGETFYDGEKDIDEIFDTVDKIGSLPKTMALNEYEYLEFFKNLKKDYDGVIHISLSGGITSTCLNATHAAEKLENVYVIDGRTLSSGTALLAIYARKLANEGLDIKEVYEKTKEKVGKIALSFIIERLDYLFKGGRCNSIQMLGANLLKIRPRIVFENGKMINDKKYRGKMEVVVSRFTEDMIEDFGEPDYDLVFLTHAKATPEMVQAGREFCKNNGFKRVIEGYVSGTVSCHCGRNTLGVAYFVK